MFKYLFVCLALNSSMAWAGFANYNSILIGDLSAGMGGAATSVIGDISSASFYNPATLGLLKGEAFSATVGIYKKFDTVYGLDQDFIQAPLRINQGFFRSLPASTGNVIDWQNYKLGLSIVVPDYETFKGDLRKTSTSFASLSYTDESLWVGGSISKKKDEFSSWGLTAYYTARSYIRSITDRSDPTAIQSTIYSQDRLLTENSVILILGYYQRLNPQWSWGSSLRLPALKVAGQATVNESTTQMDTAGPTLTKTTPDIPVLDTAGKIPGKLSLGLSYEPTESWLLALDANFYEGMIYDDVSDTKYANRVITRSIWNLSIGGQWSWADWLKLRAGLFTNFSAHPDPDPSVLQLQEDRIDMLGFSSNFVFIAKNKVGYTFGGYYTGGRGRSMQRIDQTYQVVTKTEHVFTMLVGTHFYF